MNRIRPLLPWLRFAAVLAVLLAAVRYAAPKWDAEQIPVLYEAVLEWKAPADLPGDTCLLKITGMGLYRINLLWINGKRVSALRRELQGYGETVFALPRRVFESGDTIELCVGKAYPFSLGRLYRSNTVEVTMEEKTSQASVL